VLTCAETGKKHMRKIRPGRLFWVGTFCIGVFSPGRGKRRVQQRMIEIDEQWRKAEVRAETLREELDRSYEANELLRKEIVRLATVSDERQRGSRARKTHRMVNRVAQEASQIPEVVQEPVPQPVTDHEETVPLPKVPHVTGTHVYTVSRIPYPEAISHTKKS
jgi:hypothetical protein